MIPQNLTWPAIIVTDASVLIAFLRIHRIDLMAGHSHPFLATDHVANEVSDRYPDQQRRFRCRPSWPRKRRTRRTKYRPMPQTPWLLATSLPYHCGAGTRFKRIYAQRMQIEETTFDLKSRQFGCALHYQRIKRPERLETLLLVAAPVLFIL